MSINTQTSSIAMKTLRGVFDQPKMNHRRDFLRENKLNLRELQKTTTHKLTQQKQEQERKQHKHLQRYQKSIEQNVARRSASQSRNVEQKDQKHAKRVEGRGGGGGDGVAVRQNPLPFRRSYSQQRESRENLQASNAYELQGQQAGDSSSCCCGQAQQKQHQEQQQQHHHQEQHHHHQQQQSDYRERMPRSASNISVLSKAESCDKEIQTEDINDEDFLYEALKKCSSSEVHQLNKHKNQEQFQSRDISLTRSQTSLHTQQQYEHGLKSIHTRERDTPYVYHDHYEENKSQQYTPRSQCSHKLNNGHNYKADIVDNNVDEDLEQHFQNLKFDAHAIREQEQQLSARSRQTLCSTSSKRRTNGSVHKLGSRDDIRLPRYLEKEKREKEEDRLRELDRDPNCPLDHYALTEQERLIALQKAQQKMSSLINELNHMPMTTETLRLRQRKVEIEKELQQLEVDIRRFSKPKVYVIEPPIQY